MLTQNIIQAWKDEDFRESLLPADRSSLPENPAGLVELPDDELRKVTGADAEPDAITTLICVLTLACITAAFSCYPTCNKTLVGTCPWFTAGCC